MKPLAETGVIYRAETQRALRHPKTFALLALFLVFTLLVMAVTSSVTSSLTALQRQLAENANANADDLQRGASELKTPLIWVLFGGDAGVVALLKDVPAVILIVFKAMLQFIPLYAALLGFEQLSAEVSSRSIRYLTVRARRSSILFGKLGCQATLLAGLVCVLVLGLFLWGAATIPGYSAFRAAGQAARFASATGVYVLTYVSLAMLWSALTSQPSLSLFLNLISLMAFWTLDVIGSNASRVALETGAGPSVVALLRFFSPFHYVPQLMQAAPAGFALGLSAHLAFASAFAMLAWAAFHRRDV